MLAREGGGEDANGIAFQIPRGLVPRTKEDPNSERSVCPLLIKVPPSRGNCLGN